MFSVGRRLLLDALRNIADVALLPLVPEDRWAFMVGDRMRPSITATVISFNENEKIRDCLRSLSWVDEIVVVDSGSTDGTVEIAKSFGAHVVFRPFDTFASQKNTAASLASNDWILNLDADERVSRDLYRAISEATFDVDAYDIPRVGDFLGRPVRPMHRASPELHTRLYDRRRCAFNSVAVHEVVTGYRVKGQLAGDLLHEGFRSLENLIGRFNTYSSLLVEETPHTRPSVMRLLLRPIARLLWGLFVRGAVMDGQRGFIVSMLWAYHDFQVEAKRYERSLALPGTKSVFSDRIYDPSGCAEASGRRPNRSGHR